MDRAIKILAAATLIIALISVPAYAGAAELKGWIDDLHDEAHDLSDTIEKTDRMLAEDQELTDAGLSGLSNRDIAEMRSELSATSNSLQKWDRRLTRLENDYSSFKSEYDRASSLLSTEDREYLQVDIEGLQDEIDGLHIDLDTVGDRVADLRSRLGPEAEYD